MSLAQAELSLEILLLVADDIIAYSHRPTSCDCRVLNALLKRSTSNFRPNKHLSQPLREPEEGRWTLKRPLQEKHSRTIVGRKETTTITTNTRKEIKSIILMASKPRMFTASKKGLFFILPSITPVLCNWPSLARR